MGAGNDEDRRTKEEIQCDRTVTFLDSGPCVSPSIRCGQRAGERVMGGREEKHTEADQREKRRWWSGGSGG